MTCLKFCICSPNMNIVCKNIDVLVHWWVFFSRVHSCWSCQNEILVLQARTCHHTSLAVRDSRFWLLHAHAGEYVIVRDSAAFFRSPLYVGTEKGTCLLLLGNLWLAVNVTSTLVIPDWWFSLQLAPCLTRTYPSGDARDTDEHAYNNCRIKTTSVTESVF